MSLVRAVRGALVARHTRSQMDTSVSSSGLRTSQSAIELLARSGRQNAVQAGQLTRAVMSNKQTQEHTDKTAVQAKALVNQARALQIIKPQFKEAMRAWEQGERDRAEMMQVAGKAAQNVAVTNAKTQDLLRFGHQKAHSEAAYHAYGDL